MPTPADHLPTGVDALAREIAALKRAVAELRAARRLESAAVGGGGLTVQAASGGPRIRLTPEGEVTVGDGSNPPALEFHSENAGELLPGMLAGYLTEVDGGYIPALDLVTPDLGHGVSDLYLAGGWPGGDSPVAILYAGSSSVGIESNKVTLHYADSGSGVTFDASGGYPTGESWTALPLNNSWTAYGSPYQSPIYRRQVDGVVQLAGMIAPGTTTVGTTVATLPVGYRPAADHVFKTSAGAATAIADLYVKSSGAITIQNTSGTISWLSLSGVRFPV